VITSPLLSNVHHRAMIAPVSPLLTRLIHICPSYWTIFRSFDIILEMGTVHWIGLQTQCSIPGLSKLRPRARCGPRSYFIRPAKPFCQWWKNNTQYVREIC